MPKRVNRGARREEILAAAVRVFARKGFAATRVDDVAREAGIGKGSVYLYFDSREAMLTAAFAGYAARSRALLDQSAQGSGGALDRLRRLIRSVLELVSGEPELARIVVDFWSAGRYSAVPSLDMAAVYRDYRTAVADLLRQAAAEGTVRPGLDERYAAVAVGAIEGCLIQWLVDPRVPIGDLAEPIIVCLSGLRAEVTA